MDTITAYLQARSNNLQKQLSAYAATQDAESLHQYRVECKKIKTLYLLSSYCNPDSSAGKSFKKHRKFYRASGAVRDYHVIKDLLLEHRLYIEIPEETEDEHKEVEKKLLKQIKQSLAADAKFAKKLKKDSKAITLPCVQQYLQEMQQTITILSAKPDAEAHLHDIRKTIKLLKYLSDAMPGLVQKSMQNKYNALQERIGKWHDKIVLIEYLERIQPNYRRPIRKLQEGSRKDEVLIRKSLDGLFLTHRL